MADMSNRLGAKIRELRTERGYTIESFAHDLGFSWITVSRYERGERRPNIERLYRVADVLNVPVEQLLEAAA